MTARMTTVAFSGISASPIDVQVQVSNGLPAFTIVGLPDKAVAESRERIRAALTAMGLSLPAKRVTVNLAPADLPKNGSHYDLPMALAIMVAIGALPDEAIDNTMAMGELSLDGRISRVSGVLPAAILAHERGETFVCPEDNGPEAAWASEDIPIVAPKSLLTLIAHLNNEHTIPQPRPAIRNDEQNLIKDLSDIKGQYAGKRALEIAAAGGHNMLMIGPPGSGKSMLAERLSGILPTLSPKEVLEVSMIQSVAGYLGDKGLSHHRPFRSPHHSASMPALVGGGVRAAPGEVSLAHRGILFLDELPEFQPQVLDALRQPLESGSISVARVNHHVTYPARFQLIAAMNPCRCGYAGEPGHTCKRGEKCKTDYQARLSGPFLDRIDIHIEMPRVRVSDLAKMNTGEQSEKVRQRVERARWIQAKRFEQTQSPISTNAEMSSKDIDTLKIDEDAQDILQKAAEKLKLTARSYHRAIKVAQTIADLSDSNTICKIHMAEALSLRALS